MEFHDEFMISVIAVWNDWRSVRVRLGDLREVHWHQPRGAPHPLIHAYLSGDSIANSELSHHCDRESAAHRIRVCVVRSHNVPAAYNELVRRAAPAAPSIGATHGGFHIAGRFPTTRCTGTR